MQENDFEKQAKKLMDDLRIDPSEPVWNYVEKRIPKSNRRRRFVAFFFLFAGLAVCGYFGYKKFYMGNYEDTVLVLEDSNATVKKQSSQPAENKDELVVINDDNKDEVADNTATNKNKIAKKQTEKRNSIGEKKTATYNTQKKLAEEEPITLNKSEVTAKEELYADNIIALENSATNKKETVIKEDNDVKTNDDNTKEIVEENATSVTLQSDSVKNENIKVDSLQKEELLKESKKSKPKIQPAVNKKIQFGIAAFYGKSDVIEKISLGSFGAEKALYDGSFSTPGMGSGNMQRDSIFYENNAKNVKAKQSFSIGLSVRKQISKSSIINSGIEFTQIKTLIQTGIIKDSGGYFSYNNSAIQTMLSNYYTAGGNIDRINTYNFIRIPLFYSYQLNNSKKVLLNVDGGLSYARLISANALVYDSYNQAYYKNNDILNKNQYQFLLGFNTAFLFKNKSSVVLGPQVQYSISNVSKNYTTQQHFFTWGLQARYYLKK